MINLDGIDDHELTVLHRALLALVKAPHNAGVALVAQIEMDTAIELFDRLELEIERRLCQLPYGVEMARDAARQQADRWHSRGHRRAKP